MNPNMQVYIYWRFYIIPRVIPLEPHVPVVARKKGVPHPTLAGFEKRSGALNDR